MKQDQSAHSLKRQGCTEEFTRVIAEQMPRRTEERGEGRGHQSGNHASLRSFSPASPQPRPAPSRPRPGSSQPRPCSTRPRPVLSGNHSLSCLLSAGPLGRGAVSRRTTSHSRREEPRAEDGCYWELCTVLSVTDRCADEGESHLCDSELKAAGLGIQVTVPTRAGACKGV